MRYGTHRPLSAHAKSSPQHARHLHRGPSVGDIAPRRTVPMVYLGGQQGD
jgi:hypothetical protein